jgi:DNA-binding response OmpR family regulator
MPRHVLIVDDDLDFAESLADVLEQQRLKVTLAHSGEEGLARVRERPFDLVLLDMKMPGMDGLECLTAMRAHRPGIDVVMVTAFTKGELIRQALQAGALAVLHKPFAVAELLEVVGFLKRPAAVLLVEDEADQVEELGAVLTREGFTVRSAGTLAGARAELSREPVDLVLLDYRLPDGEGKELVEWLAAQERSELVVILTAYPELALDRLPCLSARDILVKPFAPSMLLDRISKRLALGSTQR